MAKTPNTPDAIPIYDITKMSDAEIVEFQRQRRLQQAKLVAEKGKQAKTELEAYCLTTYGLSLQQIFMSGGNAKGPTTYKHPENGSLYTYSGKGKVPAWLKGPNNKPNPAYEVKSN